MKTFFENVEYIQQRLLWLCTEGDEYIGQRRWLIKRLGQCVKEARGNSWLQSDVEVEYLEMLDKKEKERINDDIPF